VVDRVRSPHVAWLAIAVFAAVATVIAGVAVIIGSRLQEGIRDQGRGGAEASADAFASTQFRASDFRGGKLTQQAAVELTDAVRRSESIEGVRLWDSDYRLIYVSHPSLRLQRSSQPGEEFLAAAHGETESEITSLADEDASRATSGAATQETLIEVYRPVVVGGDDGIQYVLETYIPYRYVGSRVNQELRSLYLLLAGAVLLINLALFPTLRRAANALRETRERRHPLLQRRLRRSMARDELVLHYQPKVDLQTGRMIGAEALLRWRRDDGSLLAPGAFLPQAEETEIIGPLTFHVAQMAIQQCARWAVAGLELPVSINLSPSNLTDPELPDRLGEMARSHAVATSAITLEVTETAVMSDPVQAVEQLVRLDHLGFRLSIDDFGTGQSSLSRLDQLPFSELKIDRSLISPLESAHNPTLVKAIISLAHLLGMTAVAEGVEQEHTPALLLGLGCDEAQGFFFSRPVEPDQLAAAVRAHVPVTNGSRPHSTLSEDRALTVLPG
jgi:EAL domain-containing protein (putative c-di-GMP-specific phosphodiesterase class I)